MPFKNKHTFNFPSWLQWYWNFELNDITDDNHDIKIPTGRIPRKKRQYLFYIHINVLIISRNDAQMNK